MRLGLVLGVIGRALLAFSASFLVPLALAVADRRGDAVLGFVVGGGVSGLGGFLLARGAPRVSSFRRAEALAVVSGAWLLGAVAAAVPFLFEGLSPIDALFESMSGLTTTGATVLTDFGHHSRAFFLWRAVTQWLGGIGVIALFVFLLPRLAVGGRQLFFAEASSAPGDAISPRVRSTARRLWLLYALLTGAEIVMLLATGMPLYDAVLNAFGTLSAGGYSPNAASIAGYANPAAEWVITLFMFLAGASFTLQWRAFSGRPGALLRDPELRLYALVFLVGAVGTALAISGGKPAVADLRAGAFQSASVISSTGFASTDYDRWPDAARVLLVVVMAVGSCAGSAGGGPKVVRWAIVAKFLRREATQTLHPQAVLPIRFKGRKVESPVLRAVVNVVVLFVAGYVVVGTLLVLLGMDLVSGFTAAIACLNNCGPGLGTVGPMASYEQVHPAGKAVLVAAMWLGRLEVVTVLALFHPHVWSALRWKDGTGVASPRG